MRLLEAEKEATQRAMAAEAQRLQEAAEAKRKAEQADKERIARTCYVWLL